MAGWKITTFNGRNNHLKMYLPLKTVVLWCFSIVILVSNRGVWLVLNPQTISQLLVFSDRENGHTFLVCSSRSAQPSEAPKDPKQNQEYILGVAPCPLTVTNIIIIFLEGGPYKPSFATVTWRGDNPKYI